MVDPGPSICPGWTTQPTICLGISMPRTPRSRMLVGNLSSKSTNPPSHLAVAQFLWGRSDRTLRTGLLASLGTRTLRTGLLAVLLGTMFAIRNRFLITFPLRRWVEVDVPGRPWAGATHGTRGRHECAAARGDVIRCKECWDGAPEKLYMYNDMSNCQNLR